MATLLLLALAAGCARESPGARSNPPEEAAGAAAPAPTDPPETADRGPDRGRSPEPARTVTEAGAFRLVAAAAGTCTLLSPEDWTAPVVAEGSRGVDLTSRDRSMYAGYGIQPINTSLAPFAGAYPPPLNDPELYSTDPGDVTRAYARILVGVMGGDPALAFTGEVDEPLGDYQLRSVASSTHRGVVFYHRAGFPGDGINYGYALPMYFALTRSDRWPAQGMMVARVAASIRCTATFVPQGPGPELGGSGSERASGDENGPEEAGYNPQLGTEYVHDPDTGENYLVDPSRHWSETGPEGPGYYAPRSGGNDYVFLQPGRTG